jgi:hypothetical protein
MSISFPKELADRKQWICWRLEPNTRDGKDSKIPYNPLTGSHKGLTVYFIADCNQIGGHLCFIF